MCNVARKHSRIGGVSGNDRSTHARMCAVAITAGLKARLVIMAVIGLLSLVPHGARAQAASSAGDAAAGTFLLTIFLRHDQSKTLDQINQHLKDSGYFKK